MSLPSSAPLVQLLSLSHELGQESRQLAILGEGNTSAVAEDGRFLVKASGARLADLSADGVTACELAPLVALLDAPAPLEDDAVESALLAARVDAQARKPSVEAMFHAWLLTLPGVRYVGHTHPVPVNALLCSAHAQRFAQERLFPDQIVCCGGSSPLVPYTDPGLPLARAIRQAVLQHQQDNGEVPRLILLENHGLIALGASPAAVLAATLMCSKAAEIWLRAASLGEPQCLSREQVERIAGRRDEHYRQRALGL